MAPTDFAFAWLPPITLFFAVDIGIRINIVLVLPPWVLPLLVENADHGEGHLLDPHQMKFSGSASPKRFWFDGLSQQGHLGGAIHVLLGEGSAVERSPTRAL